MPWLRTAARMGAHLIVLLLALSWAASGLASLAQPLFDLGTSEPGDTIIAAARTLGLGAQTTLDFAEMLAGAKLLIAGYLLAGLAVATYEWITRPDADDALLEASLMVAAGGTLVALAAAAFGDPSALPALSAELLLCTAAGFLAAVSRTPDLVIEVFGFSRSKPSPAVDRLK